MVPWVTRRVDPIMATGWHMLLGGLPLLVLAVAREGPLLAARLPLLTGEKVSAAHARQWPSSPGWMGAIDPLEKMESQCMQLCNAFFAFCLSGHMMAVF